MTQEEYEKEMEKEMVVIRELVDRGIKALEGLKKMEKELAQEKQEKFRKERADLEKKWNDFINK